jgi:hypothetical protein
MQQFAPYGFNDHSALDYFCQRSNPFYDVNCSNETLKMQRKGLDHLWYVALHLGLESHPSIFCFPLLCREGLSEGSSTCQDLQQMPVLRLDSHRILLYF